jgi:hypothetical protein
MTTSDMVYCSPGTDILRSNIDSDKSIYDSPGFTYYQQYTDISKPGRVNVNINKYHVPRENE